MSVYLLAEKRYAPATTNSPVLSNNNNIQTTDTKCTASNKKLTPKLAAPKTPLKGKSLRFKVQYVSKHTNPHKFM